MMTKLLKRSSVGYSVDAGAELMSKSDRIKNTLRETKERRETQRVFVYELWEGGYYGSLGYT